MREHRWQGGPGEDGMIDDYSNASDHPSSIKLCQCAAYSSRRPVVTLPSDQQQLQHQKVFGPSALHFGECVCEERGGG